MRTFPVIRAALFFAFLVPVSLMVGCDAAADPPSEEFAQSAAEAAAAASPASEAPGGPMDRAPARSGQAGTAHVELNGDSHRLLVVACRESEDDPTGMIEFAGTAVHPDVPPGQIEAVLRAEAEDDGGNPAASMARNTEALERILEFGPSFSWYRTADGEDEVLFLPDAGFLRGESGWGTMTMYDQSRFITRDGDRFRGATSVDHLGNGESGTLSFEAGCP